MKVDEEAESKKNLVKQLGDVEKFADTDRFWWVD